MINLLDLFQRKPPQFDIKKTAEEPAVIVTPNERAMEMIRSQTDGRPNRLGATKLEELQFDPIEQLLEQIKLLDSLLAAELARAEPRVSALTNYTNSRQRIMEVLLPYRYGKVNANEDDGEKLEGDPLVIRLTFGDDTDAASD